MICAEIGEAQLALEKRVDNNSPEQGFKNFAHQLDIRYSGLRWSARPSLLVGTSRGDVNSTGEADVLYC
jgi:hypothetical protein